MYLANKYTKWYYQIINHRLYSPPEKTEYTERHHIIPRSLGGTNDKNNLIRLTAREHFVCHWLLSKMTIGENNIKMLYALNAMRKNGPKQKRYSTIVTSKVYDHIKNELSTHISKRTSGSGNPMYGKSAVKDNNLKWYNNGKDNIYVSEGSEPIGYSLGRIIPSNYRRYKKRACISPSGEIFESVHDAAIAYNTTAKVIRERIRRHDPNKKQRKNSSMWRYD